MAAGGCLCCQNIYIKPALRICLCGSLMVPTADLVSAVVTCFPFCYAQFDIADWLVLCHLSLGLLLYSPPSCWCPMISAMNSFELLTIHFNCLDLFQLTHTYLSSVLNPHHRLTVPPLIRVGKLFVLSVNQTVSSWSILDIQ
ncbi:hypothetical protein Tco_0627462 [Tanacetum coccineum]|uniref:Uncharacterized protein n=1 Tax=Tanacetum coccineum TaxID=301880 RepID=A0ABQ4WMJ0_9ASTR